MAPAENEEIRKLAAIMFTDIKGFSKKMAANETAAMRVLKVHDNTMKGVVAKHGGRVIKSIGDSFMVDFSSAVNAVKCAIEVQETFWSHNEGKSEFEKIEVRIGIHLGDVVMIGEDIFGDGVNVAARIEATTEPNRICISQEIYNQVKKKMNFNTYSIGAMKFKNIDEPVEVYEVLIDSIPELAQPSQTALHASTRKAAEAIAKQEAKEVREIEAAKRKVDEERDQKIQDHYRKALEFFQQGQLEEAETEIHEIYKLIPLHAGAQTLQTQIEEERFRRQEEGRRRIEAERKAEQERNRRIGEFLQAAKGLLEAQQFDDAIAKVQEALALDATHAEAKQLEENINQAKIEFEKAKELAAKQELERLERELKQQREVVKRQEQRRITTEEKKKLVNIKLLLRITGGVIGAIVLIILGFQIKKTFFPKTTSLAVVAIESREKASEDNELGKGLAALLSEDFARHDKVSVVASAVSLHSPNPNSFADLARELNVQQIVLLSARETRQSAQVEIQLFDREKNETIWNGNLTEDLLQLRKSILSNVLEKLDIDSTMPLTSPPASTSEGIALYLRASWLIDQNDTASVNRGVQLLQTALQTNNTSPQIQAALGKAALQKYKLLGENDNSLVQEAVRKAQAALVMQSDAALAHKVFGEAYRYEQRFADAKKELLKTLSLQPDDAECYRHLSLIALVEGNYDQATEHSRTATVLDPKNPESYVVAGIVLHFKKDYSSALNFYQRAVALGANDSLLSVRYKFGAWIGSEMAATAENYFRRTSELAPNDYRVFYWLGTSMQLKGVVFEAKPILEKALTLTEQVLEKNPENATAYAYHGLVQTRLAKFEEAISDVNKARNLTPQSATVRYMAARVYALQGAEKKKEAIIALKEAIQSRYDFSEILNPDFAPINKDPEFIAAIHKENP